MGFLMNEYRLLNMLRFRTVLFIEKYIGFFFGFSFGK